MKAVGLLVLALAGVVLGWIALSAEGPLPVARAVAPPEVVPMELSGTVPDDCIVRTVAVDGICCSGCAGKLYVAAEGVDGVREVAIDTIRKRAMAVVPSDFDVARLESALTFDKYTAHADASQQ